MMSLKPEKKKFFATRGHSGLVIVLIRTCEAAITKLEAVDDITDKYNIEFVKINNKKYARSLGIR